MPLTKIPGKYGKRSRSYTSSYGIMNKTTNHSMTTITHQMLMMLYRLLPSTHAVKTNAWIALLVVVLCFDFFNDVTAFSPSGPGNFIFSNSPSRIKSKSTTKCFTKISILIKEGPFKLPTEKWWGVCPLLIKSAFDVEQINSIGGWPTLEDTIEIACDEDAESRLVTYTEKEGFQVELGPFENEDVETLVNGDEEVEDGLVWSLLVNDVDRFLPSVSDWIDEAFEFIPNWRRDDGQISIANAGGGIGSHVDNYDVFLIQTSGRRKWKVGTKLMPVGEEYKRLIPGLDIRVLDEPQSENDADFEMVELILEAGDVLYLPPRVPHWGTALTDGCTTFSVGCRAPSGAELVARVAEKISSAITGNAVKRYEDANLFDDEHQRSYGKGEITAHSKKKAKQLIESALDELLTDDNQFDEWFGMIVTEPKRVRSSYPIPLDAGVDDPDTVWDDPASAVKEFINGGGFLHHAEGITFAYSTSSTVSRLFANGECWEVSKSVPVDIIANKKQLSSDDFIAASMKQDTVQLLESLVAKGLLYGADT